MADKSDQAAVEHLAEVITDARLAGVVLEGSHTLARIILAAGYQHVVADEVETPCADSPDDRHCVHWYDDPRATCCYCKTGGK